MYVKFESAASRAEVREEAVMLWGGTGDTDLKSPDLCCTPSVWLRYADGLTGTGYLGSTVLPSLCDAWKAVSLCLQSRPNINCRPQTEHPLYSEAEKPFGGVANAA